ncbi:hypothetical protein [Streptococcus acidominimus]|uniref:SpeK n=2 Tax=Streptococcus acidominimus TaxID=1326 RepID=A0A1Q8EDT9_STRAI|nr:hypothetical protein [Streptococcus acidominimus]MBF0838724.1 hypothetical protein [Streptococcus acidominimus]MBF0846783.1 hypothetical protein [Streptococcus danieliae]OLF49975.1 hypothetical protein BU200_04515 [Streptococcus acidominimus]SUN04895.1 Uncharacterised protein [Streptococcus acidominimus]
MLKYYNNIKNSRFDLYFILFILFIWSMVIWIPPSIHLPFGNHSMSVIDFIYRYFLPASGWLSILTALLFKRIKLFLFGLLCLQPIVVTLALSYLIFGILGLDAR